MGRKALVFGSFVADIMARAPHLPAPKETVMGYGFKIGPGGKGFNQAVAAHKAGADVKLVTKLGTDHFAEIAENTMEQLGMDRSGVFVTEECDTGCALILVGEDSGQNEIVVVPGACLTFSEPEVETVKRLTDEKGCDYVLMQLETNSGAVYDVAEHAALNGKHVILNPAPAAAVPEHVWKWIDIVTPNEVEAEYYTGIPVCSGESAEEAAQWFHRRGVRYVIITLGDRGAYLSVNGAGQMVPPFCVTAVDTTGAGDAFNGGLLAALSEGKDLTQAVVFASAAAALSVGRIGTAPSMPEREEILSLLKTVRK